MQEDGRFGAGEHDGSRLGRLAALERLAVLDTPPDAALDRLTRLAARLLRVPVALVSLVDQDRQFFKSAVGLPEPWASMRQTPLSHSFCFHVASDGAPLVIRDAREDPRLQGNLAIPDLGVIAYAGAPLTTSDGHVVGAFCAIDSIPREWRDEDIELLTELAASAMAELELRVAVTETRDSVRRLGFLLDASAELASSLDFHRTLTTVADLAVEAIADWCSVAVVQDDGSLERVALRHRDPQLRDDAKQLRDALPRSPADVPAVRAALESGLVQLHQHADAGVLWNVEPDSDGRVLLDRLGVQSVIAAPMTARDRTFGVITFVSADPGRAYTDVDARLCRDLATRAAIALDNARLYQSQLEIAQTLQGSLLPPSLPDVPGIDVAAGYRAVGEGVEVGGDFYDIFDRGDGSWGVVIGDVCGKGPRAAALTALVRWSTRALSVEHAAPSTILERLNDVLNTEEQGERFCTVALGRLDLTATPVRLRIALGGHPAAFVLRGDSSVSTIGCAGSLVGVFPSIEIHEEECALEPGDTVVLVTDGVLEARDATGECFGSSRLSAVLQRCVAQRAAAIVQAIEEAVTAHRSADFRADDTAVLVLRVERD